MSKLKSDFKVFVSDEILDFRTLEEKYSTTRTRPNNLLHRTYSQDAIDVSKRKDIPFIRRQAVKTTDSISKPLYNSTATLADKYRYPRRKSRSRTVDTRFRKSRSPTHKLTESKSTADIIIPPMSQPKKKPFSPNHVSTSKKYTQDLKETDAVLSTNVQHNPVVNIEQENYKLDNQQETYNLASNNEQTSTSHEQKKYDVNSIGDGCNISRPSEITGDEIYEESDANNESYKMESADAYADKISPYWDDPRLLEKHNVMKPIRSQHIKNSSGASLLSKNQTPAHGLLVCRNCLATQWITTPEYKYDDKTEICNSSVITNSEISQNSNIKKDRSIILIPYMALGSIVGLLIVSFIGWCVLHCVSGDLSNLWWLKKSTSPPPDASYFVSIKEFGENIKGWMGMLYEKACEIVLMPRSGILDNDGDKEEPPSRWW